MSTVDPLPAPPLEDADGYDLRPDPLGATTVADLMECMRQYHIWAGKRGLRVMARHIEQQLSPQTLSNLLKSDQLPRQAEQVRLLIEACGGNDEDQRRFVTAWRRFMIARVSELDGGRERRGVRRVVPSAAGLLAVAVRPLPVADRTRYAEEYRSELWELTQSGAGRWRQLRYALRQLRSSLSVGFALRSPRRRGAAP